MTEPERTVETAAAAPAEATADVAETTEALAETAAEATTEAPAEATADVAETRAEVAGTAADVADTLATPLTADALLHEALVPPRAIDDVATFVPRPGSPAAEPAVQAARAEAEAAREALGIEIANLGARARDAVDVKAKVKAMPSALARDPRKIAGLGAAGAGLGFVASRMRRGKKKPTAPGLLPPEVEAALGGVDDADKVRAALNKGFTDYLESQGAEVLKKRRLPGAVSLFVLPVAATAAREAIKRAFAQGRKS